MAEAKMESKLVAEFLGVFALTFVGGAALLSLPVGAGYAGTIGVALAHGIILAVMVSATMNISGGQINPAVTLGLWSLKKIDGQTAVWYIISQLLGGIVAATALAMVWTEIGGSIPAPGALEDGGATIGWETVLLLEAIGTFLLMLAVMGTAVDERAPSMGGWGIGLTVTVVILAIGGLTGAALNPARHFGVALVEGGSHLGDIWMYWAGPIIGAVLGAQLYARFLAADEDPDDASDD
jgi:MIP family channel proteins